MKPEPRSGIVSSDLLAAPDLQTWVASYWKLTVDEHAEVREYTVIPDGCTHLAFRAGEAVLCGPTAEPSRVAAVPGSRAFGIRFQPGAARALLRLPPALELRNRRLPAVSVAGLESLANLACRIDAEPVHENQRDLAESWLRGRRSAAHSLDEAITSAVRELLEGELGKPITELAADAGLSPRQFRRRFFAAVDLSPKELAGIQRFRRCALGLLDPRASTWTRRSADHAFADQSHLIREFRRFSGMAPGKFIRRLRNVSHPQVWRPGPQKAGNI